jgi:two-component system response regulator FixJ
VTSDTVHVIDDDEAVRDSLAFLLEAAGMPVHTYESAVLFLEQASSLDGGCIVTDIRMPDMTGLDLVRHLNERGVRVPVIVITGHGDVPLAVQAMRAGVVDFIEKPFGDEVMLSALRRAIKVGRDEAEQASERREIAGRLARLSARERQVLDGLIDGQANKVVAQTLGISPRTVEVYRANLMSKMKASSLPELVRMTLAAGG